MVIRSFVLKSYSVIVMFVFAERKHLIITHTLLFGNMTAIESFSSEKNYQAKDEIVNNKK